MKRRTSYILLFVVALVLSAFAAAAQSPTYFSDGKPVSEQVYRAGLLTNEGIDLRNANRPIEARQKLTEAVRIAPDFPYAHYSLGNVLMDLREEALAEKHFEFVVVSGANFPLAWLALGHIRFSQARYREALDTFVDALNRYPEQTWRDIPELYHNYGVALAQLGEFDKAVVQLKVAVRTKGDLADSWLALATTYQTMGRYRESVEVFAEALKRHPEGTWSDKPEFYHNYGIVLAKLGELDKSIEQMKRALNAQADFPELWASLGSLYQGSGRLEEAIPYYKEFIRRFPNRPEAIIIVDLIKALEDEIELTKADGAAAKDKTAKDYYAAIIRNGAILWPAKKMPLRVHIESGDGVVGFKSQYTEILRTAFEEWSQASQGRVTFKFVDNGADADIRCSWTSDPSQFKSRAESGEAQVFYDRVTGAVQTATVAILTVPMMELNVVSDHQIRAVSLHEVGHALGLLEHSPNPSDIMFFGDSLAEIKRDLTERDRQTILRLYAPPNAAAKASPPNPRPR